jgi:hypothetical protein
MAWNFYHAAVCGNVNVTNGKTKELIEKHTTTGPLNLLAILRLIGNVNNTTTSFNQKKKSEKNTKKKRLVNLLKGLFFLSKQSNE